MPAVTNVSVTFYDFEGGLPAPKVKYVPHGQTPNRGRLEVKLGTVDLDVWGAAAELADWGRSFATAVGLATVEACMASLHEAPTTALGGDPPFEPVPDHVLAAARTVRPAEAAPTDEGAGE